LAKTPRTWTGARTPSGLKRVRQANRRHEVLGPRRSAAKTYVARALSTVSGSADVETATAALTEALSALDRAAKAGAIHPNAAARRKSRLTRKVNAAVGGAVVGATGRVSKQTGKAAAAKAAKARIAASKSTKAKGAQTAAGKARAALSKTARAEAAAAEAAESAAIATTAPAKASRATTKSTATKSAPKSGSKTTASKTTASRTTAKAPARKPTAKS
jgi:DNA-binding protein HU-beta